MTSKHKYLLGPAALVLLCAVPTFGEDEKKVNYEEHIKPIFREHCLSCHNQQDKQSDLALDTYVAALTGGSSGEIVKEGNSSGSRLMALINHSEQPHMPPDQDPIPEPKRNLIKTWIEQGMPENSGSMIKRTNKAAAALLTSVSAGKPDGPPAMPEKTLRQPVTVTPRSAAIAAMAASPWAPLFAIGGQNQVSLYHSQTGELSGIIPFPEGEPQSLTFTRDGKQLLIGGGRHSHSGCAVLVDVTTGERIAKVGDELDIVLAADITFDKKRIAIGGPQKMVRIFDTFTGKMIVEMNKHTDWIFALRFSPDGVLLASGDRANGLVVWEAQSGLLYADLVGHKGEVRGLDFRPDSNVLASASKDGNVKLWDMFENKEVKSWAAHGGGATAIAYSQNGLIATAGMDARVKLWNAEGALQKEFAGLADSALEVAVTGDATQVAGGDWSGKVQLWQVADPNQTLVLAANPPSIEQRLATSQATLAITENEFKVVKQTTDTALADALAAQSQLSAAQNAAADMAKKLTDAAKAKQDITAQMAKVDEQVASLEAQLAAARQQKVLMAAQMEQINTSVTQLTEGSKAANDAMAVAQAKQAELAKAADAAKAKQAEADAKLAAARIGTEKAIADKAALDAYAAKLQQETQEMAAKAKQLADQLAASTTEKQMQEQSVNKIGVDLKALQEQLAAIQKQVESTAATQVAAQQQLLERQKKADELKAAQEAAEQAALEAKEKLDLFQSAYGPK
jgi:Planctomycete cytochrome C/WD domain, G-beta repeat